LLIKGRCRKKQILKSQKISDGWFSNFIKRNPKLSLHKGDATVAVLMDCLNKKTIDNYFANLKECLEENNLMNIPGQLYNVDKTGIPLDHCQPKAVAKRGKQKIRCCTTENKVQITVIGCVSAL